jgi:hypothetical protein
MAEDSGGVSGIGVAAVFAGGILLWSGIKGYSVSQVFRDLIAGKSPAKETPAAPVSVGGLFSPLIHALNPVNLLSSGSGSGTPQMTGTGTGAGWSAHDRSVFASSLLATIGAPRTQANINSILAWINHEGGGGSNNPLNTTMTMPGSSNFNNLGGGQGVQNFLTLADGVAANARTLMGSNYSDVRSALMSGQGLCGQSFSGLSTWSGGGYSSVC